MAGTEVEVLTLCPWSQSPGTLQPLRPDPRPFSGLWFSELPPRNKEIYGCFGYLVPPVRR